MYKGRKIICTVFTLILLVTILPIDTMKVHAARTTVSTLEQLQEALADDTIDTVIVSGTIALPSGTILDGKGKTVQVANPYLTENGVVNSGYSTYAVFIINTGATVTIENMVIYGGSYSNAGGIVNNGTMYLKNSTISRSYRALYIGSGCKSVLINTNIIRNVCSNGGGILCAGGTLIMDGCSFSENRSTSQGGGAMEIKSSGTLYTNNTIIANNCSSEIGGAINVYRSNVYIMNSAIVGNITTKSLTYGGGIGINGGNFFAVNSIFNKNYYISEGIGTPVTSDIGVYSGTDNTLQHCVYGDIPKSSSSVDINLYNSTQITDDSLFLNYREDGIMYGSSNSLTTGYKHPALNYKVGNKDALYVRPSSTGPAVTGGVATYFDYSDLSSIKMSYGPSNTAITSTAAPTTSKVTTYFEGGVRAANVIGPSASTSDYLYTLKLKAAPTGGKTSGISTFGDGYAANSEVTIKAIPNTGYVFEKWVNESGGLVSENANYTFTITQDTILDAKFKSHTHSFTVRAGTGDDANKLYAHCDNTPCSYYDNDLIIALTPLSSANTNGGIITWREDQPKETIGFKINGYEDWEAALGTSDLPVIYYEGINGTSFTKKTSKPYEIGSYKASITSRSSTAFLNFEIKKNLQITYDANGGNGEMPPVSVGAGLYDLPDCKFKAPKNQEFAGWSDSRNGPKIEGSQITVTDDMTLYALWQKHDHSFVTTDISSLIRKKSCSCGYYIITFK